MKKFLTVTGEKPVLHRNTANLMQNMLDDVKANITVLADLKALIPPLQTTEYEQLSLNILKDGCREPLLIWQTTKGNVDGTLEDLVINVLIDGHNRYEICKNNGLDFKVALRDFRTLQEVRDFMIDNQLGRRNLSPEQMSYLRGLKYRNERQAIGRPGQIDKSVSNNVDKGERTREKLAREFNVSPRTIVRDKEYSEGIDRLEPTLKQNVLKGTTKIPKEIVREIGRTVSPTSPPLSYAQLEQIIPKQTNTFSEPNQESNLKDIVKQIALIANKLDPERSDFITQCNGLIALLNKVQHHT